nr:unnamed protein product [Naegleria fowleri]
MLPQQPPKPTTPQDNGHQRDDRRGDDDGIHQQKTVTENLFKSNNDKNDGKSDEKSVSEEGVLKFLQNENRYHNPFITQFVGEPTSSSDGKLSTQQKRKFTKEKKSDDSSTELSFRSLSDSEDHDDSDGSHRPPPAFAPSKKYRKIISSSRSSHYNNLQQKQQEENLNVLESNPMVFANQYDSENDEEVEEEYESMAPYRTTTLSTLITEYHLEDWVKKHSICEKTPKDTLIINLFMTNRHVISTLQKLRLRHGLEIEFGSNLFYNVWEFSQRRLFSQLMLGLSPKLYMENVDHLKSYSEAQPSSKFLKQVVENYFVKKQCVMAELEKLKITEDLSSSEELKRVAQFVIQSKQKRKFKIFTCCMIEWSEEIDVMSTGDMSGISVGSLKSINFENGQNLDSHTDTMHMLSATILNTDTNSDTGSSGRHMRFSDDDPSDPEVQQIADLRYNERRYKNALYKLNRWKTEGAYLRRIHIGPWEDAEGYTRKASFSPNMFYDGQCRIKCAPLLKKLYYRFFTYVPKFLDIEQVLELLLIENGENRSSSLPPQYSKLEKHIFSELDRFKVSYCLKMEICFEDICGIHIQKVPSGNRNWALMVLKVSKKPNFYIRRIMCTDTEKNQIRQRAIDFTPNHVASKYDTHYIIGDERELKRILELMIEADKDTGNIERLYHEGLSDISFPTKPAWEIPEITPNNASTSTTNELAYPLKFSLEPGFTLKEDEEEERQNATHYRTEDGILPFSVTVANFDQETRRKYERVQLDLTDIEHASYSAEVADECFIQ